MSASIRSIHDASSTSGATASFVVRDELLNMGENMFLDVVGVLNSGMLECLFTSRFNVSTSTLSVVLVSYTVNTHARMQNF